MLDPLLDERPHPHDAADHDGARNAAEILVDLASQSAPAAAHARTRSVPALNYVRTLSIA